VQWKIADVKRSQSITDSFVRAMSLLPQYAWIGQDTLLKSRFAGDK
jgi:hypothetical protein